MSDKCGCRDHKDKKGKKKKCEHDEKIKSLINDLQRLQAEFENYKKRVEKEKTEFSEYAAAETIKALLPVTDNFELALKNTEKHDEFVKGVELVYSQLREVLSENGLTQIEAKGKLFDPHIHEALLSEESKEEAGTILEELQKGFKIKERVLRHAKVKVAK